MGKEVGRRRGEGKGMWGGKLIGERMMSNKYVTNNKAITNYKVQSYVHLTAQIFILNNLFCLFLSILMVIISLELTRANPDRNIFLINVELTSTFFTLQRFGPNFKSTFIYHPCLYLSGL